MPNKLPIGGISETGPLERDSFGAVSRKAKRILRGYLVVAEMAVHYGRIARHTVLAALILVTSAAGAQSLSPPQVPTIRNEVKEVLVPVVVTDRHGHYVTDLRMSDFTVLEDGKPQRIVALHTEVQSLTSVATSSASAAAVPGSMVAPNRDRIPNATDPRRTYLILVDTLHSSFANFKGVHDALGKLFEKEQAGDAQYAVMALGRELKVVQDSTRDVAAALAAVRAKEFSNLILDSEANNLAIAADQFTALMRQYCSLCFCESAGQMGGNGPKGGGTLEMPECPDAKNRVQAFLNSYSERAYLLDQTFLHQLKEIVRAIATMPTSRTIMFISDGFNRFPGRELYAILLGYGPQDHGFQFSNRDMQPEFDAVLKVATGNNVKFYTLDSRGLYTVLSVPGSGFSASSSSSPMNAQMDSRTSPNLAAGVPEAATSQTVSAARERTDILRELAHQTGGLFFENNNDLLQGLRQAIADGREYYVLSYVPENKTPDGTYRKIAVVVRKPDWRVTAKAGYWATAN